MSSFQMEKRISVIHRIRQSLGLYILIFSLFLLHSCGKPPENPATKEINANVNKILSENSEASQSQQSSDEEFRSALAQGNSIQIAGEAFAPGSVPEDLSGISFYPRQTAAILQFLSTDQVEIFAPDGSKTKGKYSVSGGGKKVELTYNYRGSEKSSSYAVTRGGRFAMLHLEDIENEGKPLPLMVVAEFSK